MVVVYVIGGIVIGLLIGNLLWNVATDGTLRIDHSNPDKDTYRFEVNDLDKLGKKKRIVLKVDNSAILSQD